MGSESQRQVRLQSLAMCNHIQVAHVWRRSSHCGRVFRNSSDNQMGDPNVGFRASNFEGRLTLTLAAAIKAIYTAASAEAALAELETFETGPWGTKFPTVVAAWKRNWDKVIPFFSFSAHIRRQICTTNAQSKV